MERFGKSSGPLLSLKREMFDKNTELLKYVREVNELYLQQPKRKNCKNCDCELSEVAFTKLSVPYGFCPRCGHLNGYHQDTDSFCSAIYTDDDGVNYGRTYSASGQSEYLNRVRDIYQPKAVFLRDALKSNNERPEQLVYADLGAGSGYFVSALHAEGMIHATGYEVSATQVNLANHMAGNTIIKRHDLECTFEIAQTIEADVVSLIGVLEHVQRPRDLLTSLRDNSHVRYLFISVPTFSPCVFFEMVFPDVFNRQLSGAHTHLYTESSLAWIAEEFCMKVVGSWWFGTDMFDLFRSVAVNLKMKDVDEGVSERWDKFFAPLIDELQLTLDHHRLSSEVHILYEFV